MKYNITNWNGKENMDIVRIYYGYELCFYEAYQKELELNLKYQGFIK